MDQRIYKYIYCKKKTLGEARNLATQCTMVPKNLSKNILGMKFMQRVADQVKTEILEEERATHDAEFKWKVEIMDDTKAQEKFQETYLGFKKCSSIVPFLDHSTGNKGSKVEELESQSISQMSSVRSRFNFNRFNKDLDPSLTPNFASKANDAVAKEKRKRSADYSNSDSETDSVLSYGEDETSKSDASKLSGLKSKSTRQMGEKPKREQSGAVSGNQMSRSQLKKMRKLEGQYKKTLKKRPNAKQKTNLVLFE